MSQTALGVLIFLSVLLFLALAIGIPLTIVLVRRKRVCRNSKLIAWHNAVRQKPLISKDYTHHFSRTICVNSRRSAVNFSFSKGLSSACQDSKRTLLNAIERHHYYEAIYAEYLVASKEAYQRLKATEDDAKKAKMSLASFKKIEVHFIRELGFLRDREPISITIAVSYTSPMGRSTYNNSVTFDEQAIIRYVGQPVEHIFSRPEEWKLPEEVPGATKTQKAQERVEEKEQVISVASEAIPLPKPESEPTVAEEKEQVISVASEAIPLPKPESEPTVSEEKALVTTSVDKSEGQPLSSPALEENVPAKLKKKFGYNESVLLLSLPQGYFYRVGYRKIFVFRTSHSDYGLSWREAPNPLRFEFETLFAKVCLTYINASYPPEAFIIEISVLVKCLQKAFECDDVSETDIRRIFLPEGSNRGYITRDAVSIRATRPYQERTTEGLKTEIVFASLSIGTKIPEKPKEKIIALVAGQFIEAKPVPQPIPLPAEEVKTRVIAQPLPPKKPVSHAAVQSDSSKKAESSGSIIQSPQGNGSFIDIDRKTPIKLLVMTKSGIFGINSDSDDLAFTLSPDFQRSISWREADDESIKAIKSYIADQCFDVFKNACEADGKSASPERLSREINRKLKTLAFTYRDVCEAICRGVPYNLVTLEEICQAAGREFPTHPESNPKNEHEKVANTEAKPQSETEVPSSEATVSTNNLFHNKEPQARRERFSKAYYPYDYACKVLEDEGYSGMPFFLYFESLGFKIYPKDNYMMKLEYNRLSDCIYKTEIAPGHQASFMYSNPSNLPIYEKAIKSLEKSLIIFKESGIRYSTCFAYESQGITRVQINNLANSIYQLSQRKDFFSIATIRKAFSTNPVMKVMGSDDFIYQVIDARCDVTRFCLDYENSVYIFRKKNLSKPEETFFDFLMGEQTSMEIYDAANKVSELFGLSYNLDKIVSDVKKTSFIYSDSLEKIYRSKEDYLKEVYGS